MLAWSEKYYKNALQDAFNEGWEKETFEESEETFYEGIKVLKEDVEIRKALLGFFKVNIYKNERVGRYKGRRVRLEHVGDCLLATVRNVDHLNKSERQQNKCHQRFLMNKKESQIDLDEQRNERGRFVLASGDKRKINVYTNDEHNKRKYISQNESLNTEKRNKGNEVNRKSENINDEFNIYKKRRENNHNFKKSKFMDKNENSFININEIESCIHKVKCKNNEKDTCRVQNHIMDFEDSIKNKKKKENGKKIYKSFEDLRNVGEIEINNSYREKIISLTKSIEIINKPLEFNRERLLNPYENGKGVDNKLKNSQKRYVEVELSHKEEEKVEQQCNILNHHLIENRECLKEKGNKEQLNKTNERKMLIIKHILTSEKEILETDIVHSQVYNNMNISQPQQNLDSNIAEGTFTNRCFRRNIENKSKICLPKKRTLFPFHNHKFRNSEKNLSIPNIHTEDLESNRRIYTNLPLQKNRFPKSSTEYLLESNLNISKNLHEKTNFLNPTSKMKVLLEHCALLLQINSDNVDKVISYVITDEYKYISLWYILEYNESINLDNLMIGLHKQVLGYNVESESEFVHLLYSCESILDQSKDNFSSFSDIIKYISAQLLLGISHLHDKDIVVSTLNPSNIRITTQGVLKITDLGPAKPFLLLQFDSRSISENWSYLNKKRKEFKLKRNEIYIEPHIRALLSKDQDLKTIMIQKNYVGMHIDFFSCSMILFELLFGFSYGNINLYQKYSFFDFFSNKELIFFFPDHFLRSLSKNKNLSVVLEEFSNLRLENLKTFLMNHENGFIDFLIEGLSIDTCRWSKYLTTTKNKQHFDFSKLKTNIGFFKDFDFNNIKSNIPKSIHHFLQSPNFFNKRKMNVEKKTDILSKGDLDENWANNSDQKSFNIPELDTNFNTSYKTGLKDNLDINSKFLKPVFNLKYKLNMNHHTNVSNKNIDESHKKKDKQIEENEEKLYMGVFLHKIMDKLEEKPTEKMFPEYFKFDIKKKKENTDIKKKKQIKKKYLKNKQCSLHYKNPCLHKKKVFENVEKKQEHSNQSSYSNAFENYNRKIQDKEIPSDFHYISDNEIPQNLNTAFLNQNILNEKKKNYLIGSVCNNENKTVIQDAIDGGSLDYRKDEMKKIHNLLINDNTSELNTKVCSKNIPLKSLKDLFKTKTQKRIKHKNCFHQHQIKNIKRNKFTNRLRKTFLDANIGNLEHSKTKPQRKISLFDEENITFNNSPYTSFPMLFSNASNKKLASTSKYYLPSVTSMSSKEVQTHYNIQSHYVCDIPEMQECQTLETKDRQFYEEINNGFEENVDTYGDSDNSKFYIAIEPEFKLFNKDSIQTLNNEIFCCDKESYLIVNINDVEESVDDSESVYERFIGTFNDNSIIIDTPVRKNNLIKKIVTFKFPLITDISDFDYFENFHNQNFDIDVKSDLNKNEEIYNSSFYLRPKVNEENLDIIDDWISLKESLSEEVLYKEFDLETIEHKSIKTVSTDEENVVEDTLTVFQDLDKST